MILAVNETTDSITGFALNPESGMFSELGWKVETESPVCVVFK